ncbi:facilitative glucose transporter GT1 [Besnoitia besnoiti]|uniref:Hexose transporter 1 n=1 Tax=Besnoitia besnoiti TaxID=94643 RepID=A0A2A9MH81_BESBE|nr:facilitative glucose transporter GT1 [Besnoitia besnoiti]PFH37325.1 facilitative glucose transporter GT1 [Besnoitia besnoiti]
MATEDMREKSLKREAVSLWDIPPDSYAAKGCGFLSTTAQLVLVAVLGSFQFGYNISALNTSKAFIILDFGWCKDAAGGHYSDCDKGLVYGSLINTGVFLGAFVGCLLGGRITDFGRRASLCFTHCLCLLGCVLSAAAEGFPTLLIARLIVGVAVGLFTVCVPMYCAEVTPDSSRGFFGTFHQLYITIGICVGTVLGLAFGNAPAGDHVYTLTVFQQVWWRVMLGLPAAVSLIALGLLVWVYPFETPHYMVEKKQKAKATALLREIYGREDIDVELQRIINGRYQQKIQRARQLTVWKAVVHPTYRWVIFLACLLSVMQQFSGINVLVANSNNLYSSLKLPQHVITGLTVGVTALNVVLTIITIPLVDRLGRRTLLQISLTVTFVAMCIAFVANLIDKESTAVQWVTVGCVYLFIVGFAVGYGPVLWIYLHEIFPPEIKQGAAGLASGLNWLATVAIVLPSDFLLKQGFSVFVGICTVALGITLLFTFFFVKETKGLSIEESPYFRGRSRVLAGPTEVGGDTIANPSAPLAADEGPTAIADVPAGGLVSSSPVVGSVPAGGDIGPDADAARVTQLV